MKILFMAVFASMALSSTAFSQEGRGQHKTKVTCSAETLESAKDCVRDIARNMPSENDANAALIAHGDRAKSLAVELLVGPANMDDAGRIYGVDYIGIVVQNNDEESIYYYAISKLSGNPELIGRPIDVADLMYLVCDEFDASKRKFARLKNLFLGQDPRQTLLGTVWIDGDISCRGI